MDWHEQSGHLMLYFLVNDRASRFYRSLVLSPFAREVQDVWSCKYSQKWRKYNLQQNIL